MREDKRDFDTETIVVTTEQGVVLTGSRAEALEARILASVRKPLYAINGILFVMFIFLVGVAIFLTSLSDTVHNTDDMIVKATGPQAETQQAKTIQDLLSRMNCQDQRNLQRVIDNLVAQGPLTHSQSIVDPNCP